MRLRLLGLVLLGGVAFAVAACSSDEEETGSKATAADCDAIINACHTKDDGSGGDITECHEGAHDTVGTNDFSFCGANKSRCVALCDAAEEVDGGHMHSGGTGGHSHGGTGGDAGSGGHSHGGTGGGSHAGGTGGHSHGGAGGAAGSAG